MSLRSGCQVGKLQREQARIRPSKADSTGFGGFRCAPRAHRPLGLPVSRRRPQHAVKCRGHSHSRARTIGITSAVTRRRRQTTTSKPPDFAAPRDSAVPRCGAIAFSLFLVNPKPFLGVENNVIALLNPATHRAIGGEDIRGIAGHNSTCPIP